MVLWLLPALVAGPACPFCLLDLPVAALHMHSVDHAILLKWPPHFRCLQSKNSELQEQVLCLEQQRLAAAWGEVATEPAAAPAAAAAAAAAAATAVPRPSHGLAAAGQKAGGSAASSQLPAAGRVGRASGLPAVRVERGGGSGCSARSAAGAAAGPYSGPQQEGQHSSAQPHSWSAAPVHDAGAEEAALEEAIADVELCDAEEVLVWSEEQPAGVEQLALDREQAARGPAHAAGAAPGAAAGLDARAHTAPSGAAEAQQAWLPGTSASRHSPPALPAAAAGDAMSKESSALARFNQLRSSLAQHGSLQGSLASSNPAPQPCPPGVPSAVATPQPVDGAAMLPSVAAPSCGPPSSAAPHDDLRRLGHSLLAAAAPASGTPDALPPAPSAHTPLAAASRAAVAPAAGAAADAAVVSEVQHPGGRWERLLASGAREQRFANGSSKLSLPSGASLTRFANGDVKKVLPGGAVEYYFAEVDSWQVTHPSGVEVFYFPSGQVGWGRWRVGDGPACGFVLRLLAANSGAAATPRGTNMRSHCVPQARELGRHPTAEHVPRTPLPCCMPCRWRRTTLAASRR